LKKEIPVETNRLIHVLTVFEEANISAAAQRLFISQQGLSMSIRRLEEELGVPLFFRQPRGLEPTEFGSYLAEAARSFIDRHDLILAGLESLREKAGFRLKLGILPGLGDFFPPRFFSNFITAHPLFDLEIRSFPDDTCQRDIIEHKMHLGFSQPPIDLDHFNSIYTEKHRLFLIAGAGHPLARKGSITLAELHGHVLASLNTKNFPQEILLKTCAGHGIFPQIYLSGSDNKLLFELLNTGRVVSFFAGSYEQCPGIVRINIQDMDIFWELHLIVNKHSFLSQAEEIFIDYTRRTLQDRMKAAG
jgi:DNA-binding transcriptional LysR family regulator